jgi:hypothetical protein
VGVGAGAAAVEILPSVLVIGGVVAVGASLQNNDNPTTTHHAP